ncbi:MAG: amidohydrolase family protein [Gemmatimonadota bacterium]
MPVSRAPIRDGAVGVSADRIAYVGPRDAAPPATETIDLGEAYLLPGLVNAHTHLELTVMRGYLEAASFRDWLWRLTQARVQVLDDATLGASARLGIAEGLLAGITTYADTSSTPAAMHAMLQMGVRGISYQEVFGPDPAQSASAIAELGDRLRRLTPHASAIVALGISPHAPYTVSDTLYDHVAKLREITGLPVAAHIAESRAEVDFVVRATGPFAESWRTRGFPVRQRASSPIALLEERGILAAQALLIHCVQVDDADIARIAASGASVVHCPASNAKLGHGVAPLARLLAAQIPVGLGTDSVASNNRMDLLDDARLASLVAASQNGGPALSANRVLELATLGGAYCLGLHGEIGSLDAGKSADMTAFRVDPLRDEPVYDPVTSLVFGGGGRRAIMVCVAGAELVRDGRLVASLDEDTATARNAGQRLAQFVADAAPRSYAD